ncbi:dual specificity protein kinase yak1 [Phanerochaete sordida]|uniref:Dual specificity protein kinase yak1 n=1 Tax=Phanerochaete sordida TaxID=48140 RepID=A0A9P3GI50_9APHY|nr:dual specificity protein kinase yak1 [Phanerochaete sordida]
MSTNDDFDLPRWNPPQNHDALSSSAQAAQSAAQASSYLYGQGPPPQSGVSSNRLPTAHQSPTGTSRQPRISQIMDDDPQYALSPAQYSSSGNSLSRSVSMGGAATSRGRRHHMQEDLEGAFPVDSVSGQRQPTHGLPQHHSNSLYPSSVGYHHSPALGSSANTSSSGANVADPYQDAYFPSSGNHPPKRSQTTHDASTSSRTPRSPHRGANASQGMLDPYSPQQNQYTPPSNAYPYSPTTESRAFPPTAAYPAHTRTQSQVKAEPMTPPLPPSYRGQLPVKAEPVDHPMSNAYSPPAVMPASSNYSPSYQMNATSPTPSSQNLQVARQQRSSVSQPPTPLSYHSSQGPGSGHSPYYGQDPQAMVVEPPPKRRPTGLRRVRDQRDLRAYVNPQPAGRRMDASGAFLSPARQLTTNIVETFRICNPAFRYESTHNPRRVLTKPSKPSHNDGYDNEDYDYILYVNDWLGTDEGHKYLILDILGQGTFGQVVKCQNMKTHEVVAVKVVKNKPAYFNQSMMEVTILELLNNQCDPHDEHHILRLRDSFIHKNHLCLVFELLSSNLYELIKQNQFQGLSTQLVKVFTAQLLDSLTVLKEARLIHCDLKPENILLKSLQSPQIKVIDFGSACHERQTVYTYIQSRFYRSPEVLLGIPYTAAIDMWSLGCIAVELFLGLPLFPGTSEYNQITRIVEMLGTPPQYMLDMGKQTTQFFDAFPDQYGGKKYKLKSIEQYSREHNTQEQPGKQYFKATTLPEIIQQAPMPAFKSGSRQQHEIEKEMNNRAAFIDFVQGLLNMDPIQRWSPQQARMHPFITGEKWTKPWQPTGSGQPSPAPVTSPTSATPDPKRPYGGLVPSQPKGSGAFRDAAAYNQHLAQQQAYTAQQQAAAQASQNVYRNPYLQQQNVQQGQPAQGSSAAYGSQEAHAFPSSQNRLGQQASHGQLAPVNAGNAQYSSGYAVPSQHLNPSAPSNSYQPPTTTRMRSNTMNNQEPVPAALARLQHMNQDVIGGRKALTPVLKRDDPWERRQSGKGAPAQTFAPLEILQQQAEMAASQGYWGHYPSSSQGSNRYSHQQPTSSLAHSYTNMQVDDDRRDQVMSSVRSAARADPGQNVLYGGASASIIPSPPQAYSGGATTAGNRFAATYAPGGGGSGGASASPFDVAIERRGDMGAMYVPLQPDQYGTYGSTPAGGRGVAPPAQPVLPSFYGANAVPAGHQAGGAQRNPFGQADGMQNTLGAKDARRKSGMDLWSQ